MVVVRPAPLQLLLPYPAAGSQQWSSRFPLKLEKQLHHGSVKTVQYQEHKYAYGLAGSNFLLRELVQPLVCSDYCIGVDNASNLPPLLIDKPEGAPPGLWLSDHIH